VREARLIFVCSCGHKVDLGTRIKAYELGYLTCDQCNKDDRFSIEVAICWVKVHLSAEFKKGENR